jgi:formamidopyrimidine-DNA glycosylase
VPAEAAREGPAWGVAPRRRAGRLPQRADVLIVGGGITGVSLLHWLRGRADTVLVERDRLAAGASGRNAGFLVAYGQAGRPCPRCATPMRKVVLGGRGTTFCPTCQQR